MAKSKTAASTKPLFKAVEKLERHELCKVLGFDFNDSNEQVALGQDMKANGQHQKIILFEGKVLDGWERYMGAMQQGLTPEFSTYEGTNPAAVVFGANTIRRRMSSLQKALMGARYFVHQEAAGITLRQEDVRKMIAGNQTRLNQMIRLLKLAATNAEAHTGIERVSNNPDLSWVAFDDVLAKVGLLQPNRQAPAGPSQVRGGDVDDLLGSDDGEDVDLTNGTIDDLVDRLSPSGPDDDEDESNGDDDDGGERGAVGGSNVITLPERGTRRNNPDHRARETPANDMGKNFKSMLAADRVAFVRIAWPMLRPALEEALSAGQIDWPDFDLEGLKAKAKLPASDKVFSKLADTIAPGAAAEAKKALSKAAKTKAKERADTHEAIANAARGALGLNKAKGTKPAPAPAKKRTTAAKPAAKTTKAAKGKPAAPASAAPKRTRKPAQAAA